VAAKLVAAADVSEAEHSARDQADVDVAFSGRWMER
jgi:hypothetical protein